jgi:CheY-like chemotaxis protein
VDTTHAGIVETEQADEVRTLLVVDDDQVTRELEVRILRHLGHKVLEAEGPLEAMRLAAVTPTIHLLLTEFSLPGANGFELAREFRNTHPKAPVLVVSGSLEEIYGRADYPDRFAVLAKPFTGEELVDQACALLSHSTADHAVARP